MLTKNMLRVKFKNNFKYLKKFKNKVFKSTLMIS